LAPIVLAHPQYERTVRRQMTGFGVGGRCEPMHPSEVRSTMDATWWIVLNHAQDRIILQTPSCLEAFRVAARRAGGLARLERDAMLGVTVVGRLRNMTVVPVASQTRKPDRVRLPVGGGTPVAIPIGGYPGAEVVPLPGGGSFTWIPADTPWPTSEGPVVAEHGR